MKKCISSHLKQASSSCWQFIPTASHNGNVYAKQSHLSIPPYLSPPPILAPGQSYCYQIGRQSYNSSFSPLPRVKGALLCSSRNFMISAAERPIPSYSIGSFFLPFLNNLMVGKPSISTPGISCLSAFNFAIIMWPTSSNAFATSSYTGFNCWQWPHQGA